MMVTGGGGVGTQIRHVCRRVYLGAGACAVVIARVDGPLHVVDDACDEYGARGRRGGHMGRGSGGTVGQDEQHGIVLVVLPKRPSLGVHNLCT